LQAHHPFAQRRQSRPAQEQDINAPSSPPESAGQRQFVVRAEKKVGAERARGARQDGLVHPCVLPAGNGITRGVFTGRFAPYFIGIPGANGQFQVGPAGQRPATGWFK
jgi:hypothetical protein